MIIFDLDGTLADCSHRQHFVDLEKARKSWKAGCLCRPINHVCKRCKEWQPDWNAFYEACDQDKPIFSVIDVYRQLNWEEDHYGEVEIWSGRSESVREKTQNWLWEHCGCGFHADIAHLNVLKMRPIGDTTPDDVLKEKWLDEAIAQGKKIDLVFDDSETCCKMWRRRGIFVFNCAQHNEEF